jgi:hypothetical protein
VGSPRAVSFRAWRWAARLWGTSSTRPRKAL